MLPYACVLLMHFTKHGYIIIKIYGKQNIFTADSVNSIQNLIYYSSRNYYIMKIYSKQNSHFVIDTIYRSVWIIREDFFVFVNYLQNDHVKLILNSKIEHKCTNYK